MGLMLSPETLRRYPFFAGLAGTTLEEMAIAGEEMMIRQGECLFREGDVADALYLILDGEAEIRVPLSYDGRGDVTVSERGSGEIIGWSALVEPFCYQMSAYAASNCRVAKLPGVRLRDLMKADPQVGYALSSRLLRIVGDRLQDMRVRFASLVEEVVVGP